MKVDENFRMKLVYIGIFGLAGVFARYWVGLQLAKIFSLSFPVGTLVINILGSFLIGGVFVLGVERALCSEDLRVGITVGLLGGFTTFSSYCFEAVQFIERGQIASSLLYFSLSNFLGLAACFFGMFIARLT